MLQNLKQKIYKNSFSVQSAICPLKFDPIVTSAPVTFYNFTRITIIAPRMGQSYSINQKKKHNRTRIFLESSLYEFKINITDMLRLQQTTYFLPSIRNLYLTLLLSLAFKLSDLRITTHKMCLEKHKFSISNHSKFAYSFL